MSVPFLTIADALAARYAPAAVTPPSGYQDVKRSTARLDNNLVNLPFVAVFPPAPNEIQVTYSGTRRVSVIPFRVRFHFERSSGDLSKITTALYEWMTVLYDQTHAQSKLGVSGVMKAIPTTGPGVATLPYAGTDYDGIEFVVTVWFEDIVSLTP